MLIIKWKGVHDISSVISVVHYVAPPQFCLPCYTAISHLLYHNVTLGHRYVTFCQSSCYIKCKVIFYGSLSETGMYTPLMYYSILLNFTLWYMCSFSWKCSCHTHKLAGCMIKQANLHSVKETVCVLRSCVTALVDTSQNDLSLLCWSAHLMQVQIHFVFV